MKKNKQTLNGITEMCPDAEIKTEGVGPYYTKVELKTKDGKKIKCNNQVDAVAFIESNDIEEIKLIGDTDE